MAVNSEDSPDRLNFNMPNSADQQFQLESDDNFKVQYPVVFNSGHDYDLEGKKK